MPKDKQTSILETDLLQDYPLIDFVEETTDRLAAGAFHYGNSWCNVDLKTDFLEELFDCLNYPRMILTRMKLTDHSALPEVEDFLAAAVGQILQITAGVEALIPEFDGPTNNELMGDADES